MSEEDLKTCFKCKSRQLKNNFFKDNTIKDGVQRLCITCTKQYHNNRKEQRNAYERQKKKTDFDFKLICHIRTRNIKPFNSHNIKKIKKKHLI